MASSAAQPYPVGRARTRNEARRQLFYELVSGLSGAALAVFMWGHMVFVSSILTGARGFDWLAKGLEDFRIAQPTVLLIPALFLLHAAMASRKIPSQIRERRRMRELSRELRAREAKLPGAAVQLRSHLESSLWIWQVWTGMVLLVLGSFHLVLVGIDVFTSLFGERIGIEAVSSQARVGAGLWLVYGVLLICVEFHASVGLYRLAVKWGAGSRISRTTLRRIERMLLAAFLGLGFLTLVVMAGWIEPPLAFLVEA
jgi:fumarate reductase subunit C